LYNEYVTKGKTLKEIASIFNITPMSIHQWLVKLGIPARPRGRRQ
jgi:transposase-like protein